MCNTIGRIKHPSDISYIHDMTETINYGYFWAEFAFVVFCIWNLVLTIIVYYWDLNNRGGILSCKNPYG